MYGIGLQRKGEIRTYDTFFDQIIVISLPKEADYRQITDEIYAHCSSLDVERFYVYDTQTNESRPVDHAVSKQFRQKILNDCKNFYFTTKRVTKELITNAFSETLPQPKQSTDDTEAMIASYYDVDLDMKLRKPVNRFHRDRLFTLEPTLSSPSSEAPTSSSPTSSTLLFSDTTTDTPSTLPLVAEPPVTTLPSSVSSPVSITSTPLVATNEIPDLSPSNLPTVRAFKSNSVYSSPKSLARKKRFIFASLIGAIVALLTISVTSAGVALHNSRKTEFLTRKVNQLITQQREADLDAAALTDSMLGFIELDRNNLTSSSLNEFMRIQQLFTAHVRHSTQVINDLARGRCCSGRRSTFADRKHGFDKSCPDIARQRQTSYPRLLHGSPLITQ